MADLKASISRKDSRGKLIRYHQLKCVRTNGRKRMRGPKAVERPLTVRISDFYAAVRGAFDDDKVELIPMTSIVVRKCRKKRKEDFSVDYLLPVRIGREWVGVVFRDGVPIQALMDCYDITNKAILCDPAFDTERVSMFRNPSSNRLRIVDDDHAVSPSPSPSPNVPSLMDHSSMSSVLSNGSAASTVSSMASTSWPALSSISSMSSYPIISRFAAQKHGSSCSVRT